MKKILYVVYLLLITTMASAQTSTFTNTPTNTATVTGTSTPTSTATCTATLTPILYPIITYVPTPSGPQAGGNSVTINGSNFLNSLSVFFGGAQGIITGSSSTSITVTAPSSVGSALVALFVHAGVLNSNSVAYTYLASTATVTNTATVTSTNTVTNTATVTRTNTATSTATQTATNTMTNTASKTATLTATLTPTNTPTATFTPSTMGNGTYFNVQSNSATPVAIATTQPTGHTILAGLTLTNSSATSAQVEILSGTVTAYNNVIATGGGEAFPYILPQATPGTVWYLLNPSGVNAIQASGWTQVKP